MKLEQTSYFIDNVIQFKQSIQDHVNHRNIEEHVTNIKDRVIGGILSDSRYAWLACGSRLEVFHTRSATKVAAWSFRSQHDFQTEVSCVADLASSKGKAPLLVVGLECEITGGMVCVFDIGSSRVVRAIQINDKVTSIEVVSAGCDNNLPGVLNALDGIIAVGTCKGKVLLIDLCRQICEEAITNNGDEIIRDEINSCHLFYISFDDLRTLERHKERSVNKGDHLCLQLNESSTSGVHFSLYGPDGSVRLRASMCEVVISCLHFAPALGALLVGYNFGTWQLYNIISTPFPTLDYTSPMYEDCIPVAHFTVQEPCDDPRAFCYVWAAYSLQDMDIHGTKPASSIAVMYALTYQAKEYLEGYGMLYQDLSACSVRFQVEFASLVNENNKNIAARCLSLRSYTRPVTQDAPEERLALCGLVWTCWDTKSATTTLDTYLTLFDLNQWYKEQMPSEPRSSYERYMVCVSLTELMAGVEVKCATDEIIDLRLDSSSLSPFTSPQRLEEHYYPSALAFRSVCISSRHLTWVRSSGVQRHLLSQLELAGPLCLLQPSDLYHRCVALGLCPAYTDIPANPSSSQQRAYVLSVALEHQLVRWLCRCARDWAGGAQAVAGCTIDSLLEWAWQRANALKFSCDKLCVPLFDHTGERLDSNALSHLNHAACQLKHLTTLFDTVLQSCHVYFSQQDLDDIKYQYNSLEMISTYMEVLQWLLNVGLLPECPMYMYPRADESERMSAPYPVESLTQFYTKRREELCGSDDCSESLLFIDQLVERECGGSLLCKQWECDGGSGLYPPPSLQALLRTYLIEGIDIKHKHCLFIYVFLDLAMTLDQSRYKVIITHLIKFPAVFKLSPSIIKMTQAFWQLDHGDFSTAMAQLLDPAVSSEDLKPWHHRTVLKALLFQGQHQHALLYHQVRKPPVTSVQDICIIITLLIVNDLLQEAFHFQRQNRNVYNEKKIIKHFFAVSHKMNQLTNILYLPLNHFEENAFISYLQANPADTNDILQVIFYLQRDRYEEAFRLNDRINVLHKNIIKHGLLGQQERKFRNVMVSGFKKTLPQFTQILLDLVNKQKEAFKQHKWKEIERPTPMSVMIHNTEKEAKYKSTIIQASFQKAKETWTFQETENETPFLSTPKALPPTEKCEANSLIYTSIMQPVFTSTDTDDFETQATPAKRIRLSPRQPISSTKCSHRLSLGQSPSRSLLETPIVKRKSYRAHDSVNQQSPVPSIVGTPTSILKVRSFIRKSVSPDVSSISSRGLRGTSTTPEVLEEEHDKDADNVIPFDHSAANAMKSVGLNISASPLITQRRRSPLGVSPRRPISRTPRPAVHFEDLGRPSSRSSDGSATDGHISRNLEVRIEVHREQTPDLAPSSKDSSRSMDDVFYSPDSSITDQKENTVENGNNVTSHIHQLDTIEAMDVEKPSTIESPRPSLKRKASDSVKSRRSYKPVTPSKVESTRNIRESLRSRDSPFVNKESSSSTKSLPCSKSEESSPKRDFHKISGRRSLSRQVLEHNTLTRAMQQPKMQTRLSASHIPVIEHVDDKTVGVEVSYSKTVTSIVKTTSINHSEERCDKSTLELKNVFTTEKDPETSAQIIKHVHNESTSKSSMKKVTEMTDDMSADDEELTQDRKSDYHVLSFSSDIDDSVIQKSYQNWEKENDTFLTSSKIDINVEKQQDKNETKMSVDEFMEDVSEQLEEIIVEKKDNLTETVFEDISSIIEDSFVSEESEHEVTIEDEPELSESNHKSDTEVEQHNKEFITNTEENTTRSSQSEEKVSNQSEESIDVVEVERNSISSDTEPENCLVPSSEEDSSDEKEGFISEQVEEEEQEIQSSNEESKEASEIESESSNSEIIEIKSSSEESMEPLKLNQSNELEENKEDSNEKVAMSEDSTCVNELISQQENFAHDLQTEKGVSHQIEPVTVDVPMEQEVHEFVQVPKKESSVNIKVTNQKIIITNIPVTESQVTVNVQSSEHREIRPEDKITEEVINQEIVEDESLEIPEDIREELEESEQIIKLEKSVPQAATETPQETNEIVTEERTVTNVAYTPSRRSQRISSKQENKKNDEETPKKITRRRSASTDVVEPKSPARVTRRSTSIDIDVITTSPARILRRTRSTSIDVEPLEEDKPTRVQTRRSSTKSVESKEQESEELPKRSTRASSVSKLPIIEEESRKTRASSVESTTSQRSKRGTSLEPKASSPARRGRKRSIQVDVIPEEQPNEDKAIQAALEKIPEKIEEYSATHRLTRRQKMIMEKSLEIQEMKKLQTPEIKPKIKSKHTDKDTSSPDRETSPASSVGTHSTAPSTPKRRSVRRTSTSTNTPGTPRRSTRASSKDTSDDVSSVCSVPVVQLEKLEMTRHRSLSPNAFKESAVLSPRTRRMSSRNSVITGRTDLSKISEESVEIDTASSEKPTSSQETKSKRGRSKKTDNADSQSSQRPESPANKNTRPKSTSYRPLEEYVPKYSAFKTRKSFKIKKLTRGKTH